MASTRTPTPGLASHEDLAEKLAALEKKYDARFKVVFDALALT